jgi:hypothetical protein
MKLADKRYLAWAVALALTAALPLAAGFTTIGWEISEVLGFAGALACLALCGSPVRPRESLPPVLLSLARHELLGWIALGAASLHVVVAVVSDHTVIEYLKFTTPLYQWAGIAAVLGLLILTLSSLAGLRRRLWRSHRNFQATHIALGCAVLVLLAVHVITADRYTRGYGRRARHGNRPARQPCGARFRVRAAFDIRRERDRRHGARAHSAHRGSCRGGS